MSQGEDRTRTAEEAGAAQGGASKKWAGAAPWVVVAAFWLLLFVRLTTTWRASVEQAHGWAVPVLLGYFIWERLLRGARPGLVSPGGRIAAEAGVAVGMAVMCAVLPWFEANRMWPAAQWVFTAGVAVASTGVLAWVGGWRWSANFFFPWFFATTALLWPTMVQTPLMNALAQGNAQATAELVSLTGHPAVARGNIIEVGAGFVGVEEACSGLRSLQAVWMLAWLLGELAFLRWSRRVGLVALAVAIAVLTNLARTVFLTWRVAGEGLGAIERWHDLAGGIEMVVTLAAVAAVAYGFARGEKTPAPILAPPRPVWRGRSAVVLLGICGLAEGGTRAWFAWHHEEGGRQWALASAVPGWPSAPIPERTQEILHASSADGRTWERSGDDRRGLAYVFRWENDTAVAMEARRHDPTVCMPGLGAELEAELAPVVVETGGETVPFRAYRFRAEGTTQHVFFCVWDVFESRVAPIEVENEVAFSYRWARVREGRSRADLAQIIFVLQGEPSDAAACAWLRRQVGVLLRRK